MIRATALLLVLAAAAVSAGSARAGFPAEKAGGVMVDLEFGYSTGNRSTLASTTQPIDNVRAGHVYVIAFPAEAGKGAPSSFRFCVQGTDGSANVGKRSCARFHFLPKKNPKKKRR